MDYPTNEIKLMNAKIDQKTATCIPEFARMNAALQSMEGKIQKLADASADEALRCSIFFLHFVYILAFGLGILGAVNYSYNDSFVVVALVCPRL